MTEYQRDRIGLSDKHNEIKTKFYVLSGSLSDLTKIDFSPFKLRCLRIDSEEFREICEQLFYDDSTKIVLNNLLQSFKEELMEREKLYVVLPQNFTKVVAEDKFYSCRNALLLMFPSVIDFKHIITFDLLDYKYLRFKWNTTYNFKYSSNGDYDEDFLFFHDEFLEEINSFIAIFANRINSFKYLKTAMNTYISSFKEENPIMNYLSLCMTLETIANGILEVNYRIARNVSILISKDKESAEIIFGNIQLIFRLRSTIIHGGNYDFGKVIDYLPYLRNVASRMIIEVIILNVRDINELNKKLTFTGFVNRESLSDDYKKMTINPSINSLEKNLEK